MKKLIFILLIILTTVDISYSLDTVSCKYYPLALGNSWTYSGYSYPGDNSYRIKFTITNSVVQNGHKYYYLAGDNRYFRVDSIYGRRVQLLSSGSGCSWLPPLEYLFDSLSSKLGDNSSAGCSGYGKICIDTTIISVFGLSKPSKTFHYQSWPTVEDIQYTKDFGVSYYYLYGGGGGYYVRTLIGCIINGVMYGDTSLLTGFTPISTEIPQEFKLYQNYPNPFNPSTKIRFSIPPYQGGQGDGLTKLVIYDVLGKEITTLANEQLNPGTYEVEWNTSDFPSGIYFYTLQAGSFNQTKKMVLIK
jgi:hypothetical protein